MEITQELLLSLWHGLVRGFLILRSNVRLDVNLGPDGISFEAQFRRKKAILENSITVTEEKEEFNQQEFRALGQIQRRGNSSLPPASQHLESEPPNHSKQHRQNTLQRNGTVTVPFSFPTAPPRQHPPRPRPPRPPSTAHRPACARSAPPLGAASSPSPCAPTQTRSRPFLIVCRTSIRSIPGSPPSNPPVSQQPASSSASSSSCSPTTTTSSGPPRPTARPTSPRRSPPAHAARLPAADRAHPQPRRRHPACSASWSSSAGSRPRPTCSSTAPRWCCTCAA